MVQELAGIRPTLPRTGPCRANTTGAVMTLRCSGAALQGHKSVMLPFACTAAAAHHSPLTALPCCAIGCCCLWLLLAGHQTRWHQGTAAMTLRSSSSSTANSSQACQPQTSPFHALVHAAAGLQANTVDAKGAFFQQAGILHMDWHMHWLHCYTACCLAFGAPDCGSGSCKLLNFKLPPLWYRPASCRAHNQHFVGEVVDHGYCMGR